MLDGRRQKDRKSPGQLEIRGNTNDNRNKLLHRNEGSTRIPNLVVGLAKVNTPTRITKKVNSRSSASTVVPSPSLCTTTASTTTTTTKASDLMPEILIRAQAKTLEVINKITNRVDELEHRIEDIYRKVKLIDRFNSLNRGGPGVGIKKGESSFSSGITPNILSDDSGDELSRITNETGQQDDELLSLLNQITKFFDTIKQPNQITQPNGHINSSTIPRPDHYLHQPPPHLPTHPLASNHHLVAQTKTGSMGFGLTGHVPTPTASTAFKQSTHNTTTASIRHHQQSHQSPSPAIKKKLFSSMDHSQQIDCPDSTSSPQSFRALIFESNVEHFLANLDCVPEPLRTNGHYYPPSMPTTALMPSNQRQHHQPIKSHPIIGSRLAAATLHHHPHNQPDQR